MYNQEDEIEQFFRERDGEVEKPSEPEPTQDDPYAGLPSIMRSLQEQPKDDFQPSSFPLGGTASEPVEEDYSFQQEPSFERRSFHNSGAARFDRLKEMEAQLEHDERISRSGVLAKKYMQMFLILMADVALNIASLSLASIGSRFPDFRTGAAAIIIIIAVASVAISILYGVMLIGLGRYFQEFKTAGIYFMISGACGAVEGATGGILSSLFSLVGAVFAVLYVLKFAVAMSNSFDNVASYMAISWENFKKAYIYVYGGIVICTVATIVPVLNILALIALLVLSLAVVALSIWQIILVLRSSNVMKQYSTAIHA